MGLNDKTRNTEATATLVDAAVSAGFPAPQADAGHSRIDLNDTLGIKKAATFLLRVVGDSMSGIGIYDGDTLVVDKSIEARHGHIVIAIVDEEFTVKRLHVTPGRVALIPENSDYSPIELREGHELRIWGVVTASIRRFL